MRAGAEKASSGPRGLSKEVMLTVAVSLMEEAGAQAFSVRKLAAAMGCDPMAVLYHFKSKDGLYRAMADWITAQLEPADLDLGWEARLCALAHQYRRVALCYPQTFGLMSRFLNTGVADFVQIEAVYAALEEAGVAPEDAPATIMSWYGTVIGLALCEVSGLIRPATAQQLAEVASLPELDYPRLKRYAPLLADLQPGRVFGITLSMLHAGIADRAKR